MGIFRCIGKNNTMVSMIKVLALSIVSVFALLCFFSILTGCHTLSSSNKEHNKKTTAAEINLQLGMAYLEKHEIQRAKQKLLLALHEAPQLPEVWYSLAYFFEVTGDQERAKRSYIRALELAPKRGDTNNNYGTFLCRSHHYQASIKYFLTATQDEEYLDTASAYENAGLCAELIPAPTLAMKYFERAFKQDPNRPGPLLDMAELHYKQGHYDTAAKLLQQFLMLSPSTPASQDLSVKLKNKGIR